MYIEPPDYLEGMISKAVGLIINHAENVNPQDIEYILNSIYVAYKDLNTAEAYPKQYFPTLVFFIRQARIQAKKDLAILDQLIEKESTT